MPTKILAIDDSKTMRLAIKITFAAEDAEVVAVSKGSEAVARAKQMGANVVLVDHTLAAGEPSGWEVCTALKSDPGTASIPVIMLVKGAVDEAQLKQAGADGAIGKPFDTQELIDKVRAVQGKPAAKPAGGAVAAAPAAAPRPAAPVAAAPAAAPKPAARAPAAVVPPVRAAPTPAAKPAARPASGPKPAARPAATPRPAAAPAARPATRPASGPGPAAGGDIPIAVPIPFTSAASPTPGILKRLQDASGAAAAGIDPQTAAALVALSKEVVEQIVWEVVPELAEAMIREKQASA